MFQDYKDLVSAFHAHGVKYLIVGGYAAILHAQPRFTKDLDFLIRADPANARAIFAALAEFGARCKEFVRRILLTAGVSFASDVIRTGSIFSLTLSRTHAAFIFGSHMRAIDTKGRTSIWQFGTTDPY